MEEIVLQQINKNGNFQLSILNSHRRPPVVPHVQPLDSDAGGFLDYDDHLGLHTAHDGIAL